MKKTFMILVILILCTASTGLYYGIPCAYARQTEVDAATVQDGPYVFWIGERAFVQYIENGQKQAKVFDRGEKVEVSRTWDDSGETLSLSGAPFVPEPDILEGVPAFFAVSDIHGKYDTLIRLLEKNRIIDGARRWDWGDGHLVIVGDVFDRGDQMTEALWFIYGLEQEARQAGGRVHLLLGNHEMMVLQRDLRYVAKKYTNVTARVLKINVADLYGPDTELGRWLRSKHALIKLNDVLFVHGGISPELLNHAFTIPHINEMVRGSIDARDYEIELEDTLRLLHGSRGPFWYRGYFRERQGIPMATAPHVKATCEFYSAGTIVVGHTIVDELTVLFDGRVIAVETGMHSGAEGEGLLVEDGVFYRCNAAGERVKIE